MAAAAGRSGHARRALSSTGGPARSAPAARCRSTAALRSRRHREQPLHARARRAAFSSTRSALRPDRTFRACPKAVAIRPVRDAARQLAPPDQRQPRTWLRHSGQRAADAAGQACARSVHRDVPLRGRRRRRRHLPVAGGPVPAGSHALPAPRAAGRQLTLGRHGRQRRPQLLPRLVRHLRRRPGRGGVGALRDTATACMPFDSRSTTSRGRVATCCTSTSTTERCRAATAAPQPRALREAARRRARGSRPPDRLGRRPGGGRTAGARRAQRHQRRSPLPRAVGDRDVRGPRGPRSGRGRTPPGEDVAHVCGAAGTARRAGRHVAGARPRAGRSRRDRRPPVHPRRSSRSSPRSGHARPTSPSTPRLHRRASTTCCGTPVPAVLLAGEGAGSRARRGRGSRCSPSPRRCTPAPGRGRTGADQVSTTSPT